MKIAKFNGKGEIFYTIQGEGKSLGKPTVFIRSSLCNLHCIWCDTDYTWNWKNTPYPHVFDQTPGYEKYDKKEQIVELSTAQIIEEVEPYACKNLVLTGGEPFLQQKAWVELMAQLRKKDAGYWFEVETNGTLLPSSEFDALIDQYNVSPKLENSNNSMKIREKPEVYAFFRQSPKAWFKFVIAQQADLEEVLALIKKYDLPSHKVYLMPEGTTPEQLKAKQLWLVEQCKQYGFHYTDRLHIHIYGSKRGV
ncbi:7-carboxy-7-deazaguanine synthase QueE [uncultured Microscilla sp.]|uniref:7-carboxy-7-deazaguanine synthase QueE n=1 Tax=uncultured Microscilla sp. TaxID=432653 RepID=UPI002615DCF6|nr:7-carboxy-7-deazaguanine synthase QueE [uncultured Microscilla sp.]